LENLQVAVDLRRSVLEKLQVVVDLKRIYLEGNLQAGDSEMNDLAICMDYWEERADWWRYNVRSQDSLKRV
jgi:hypothetical protein